MTSPAVAAEADQLIREELAVRLTHGHDAILRRIPDLYRRIIGEALAAEHGQLGQAAKLRAAQRALDRMARIGVADFVDTAGRRWNAQSYVEMAVRSASMRALTDAHMRVLTDRGVRYVYVTATPGQCELCRPWESTILSIGPVEQVHVIDGQVIAHSVADAIAAGLQHPNCRHRFLPYLPGRTEIPPALPDPDAYEAQQRLRALERQVRYWRRRQAAALTPAAEQKAARHLAGWQAEIRAHVAETGVRRLYGREQITRALVSPTPRARPPAS